MADIDIQEKRRSAWPWIIGLLGLVLVVWVAAEMLDGPDDEYVAADITAEEEAYTPPAAPEPTGTDAGMPSEVTRFEERCAAGSTTRDEMSLDHAYVEACVTQMTEALNAVIERGTVSDEPLSEQLADLRSRAEQLTANRESTEHSAYLRNVFDGAAALIARIEETREAGADALERRSTRVQDAAESFSTDRPLMEQRSEVAAFFDEAAGALRAMASNERSQNAR